VSQDGSGKPGNAGSTDFPGFQFSRQTVVELALGPLKSAESGEIR
jgi:hypothetical protein